MTDNKRARAGAIELMHESARLAADGIKALANALIRWNMVFAPYAEILASMDLDNGNSVDD